MATELIVTCDVEGCDKKKKDVNHWFKVEVRNAVFKTCSSYGSELTEEAKDVCGVEHAVVMYTRFLSHGTLDMSKPHVIALNDFPEVEPSIDNIPF